MSRAGPPVVSVVMPVFNAAGFVLSSLASVLDHNAVEMEVICVDDGSTDASANLLRQSSQSDPRIRLLEMGANQGASAARNAGMARARGSYIFFLDSDDTVPPGALDALVAAAANSGCSLTIGKLLWLKREEEASSVAATAIGSEVSVTNINDSQWLQSVSGSHCCNLYSRMLLEANEIAYDTDLTYGEDQLFQARAFIAAGQVAIIDEVVYAYHHYRSESVTRSAPSMKNVLDGIEFKCRIARLFNRHGLTGAALRFNSFWSYSIREYWLKMPKSLRHDEIMLVFSAFRSMAAEFAVVPWNSNTPGHHRHLLSLIMAGADDQALVFLTSDEAHNGFSAATRPTNGSADE